MPTMKRFHVSRSITLVMALAAIAVASCSSSGPPPQSAYIGSTLGINVNDLASTMSCTNQEANDPYFTVGSLSSSGVPSPVPTNTSVDGNVIGINCDVASSGTGSFSVNLEINQGEVGAITISGMLTDSMAAQGNVSAVFTTTVGGTAAISYASTTENPCTITLNPKGNPPITAGRIWGTLNCPMLTDAEANATCLGTAQFLFEECGE